MKITAIEKNDIIVSFKILSENNKYNVKILNSDIEIPELLHCFKFPQTIKIDAIINGEYKHNIDAYYQSIVDDCYLENGIIKHRDTTYHNVYYFFDENNVFYFQPIFTFNK